MIVKKYKTSNSEQLKSGLPAGYVDLPHAITEGACMLLIPTMPVK